MKKLLSLVLSLMLVLSIVPGFALSASAYQSDTVCVIGETEYSSLFGEAGALNSASDGDTIVLVKDVKETGGVTLDKAVTIDLAGYNLIAWGSNPAFKTTAKLEFRSTVDGLGEQNTDKQAKASYSGTFVSTSADFSASNIVFAERNAFPEYDDSVNLLEDATWLNSRYSTSAASGYQDYDTFGDKYSFYAARTEEHIPVTAGDIYYFDLTAPSGKNMYIEVFGFDENDKISRLSASAATRAITIPDGIVSVAINMRNSNYTYPWDGVYKAVTSGAVKAFMYTATKACETVATSNEFVVVTADNTTYSLDNCYIDKTYEGTTSVLTFDKATTFDVKGTTFKYPNMQRKTPLTFNNAGIKGEFKNSQIASSNANGIYIKSVGDLKFTDTTVTTSGDGGVAPISMDGGTVEINGGTIGANNSSSYNFVLSGGNLTIKGNTLIEKAKTIGFKISEAANLTIESIKIKKSATTISDTTKFLNSLAAGKAVYTAEERSVETIVSRSQNLNSLDTLYVLDCEHFCISAQDGSTTCAYCETENADISHNFTDIRYDENNHWHKCTRCDEVTAPEQHQVGENGVDATCTTAAICGVCEQSFGNPLGHSFTDFQPVSTDEMGCEHNVVTKAYCDNGCGEVKYDYSALINLEITKEAIAPTCTEVGYTAERSCTLCGKVIEPATLVPANGHTYGEETVEVEPTYRKTGKGYKICQVEGCGYKHEYVIPMKEYSAKYSAIIGETGDNQYETVADAIAAAEDGDVIVLIRDVVEDITTSVTDKKITIDLAGYSFTASTETTAITTNSDITFRSTVGGWGDKDMAVESSDPNYFSFSDVSNPDSWQVGQYSYNTGLYDKTSTGRACLKKLIPVKGATALVVDAGSSSSQIKLILREYDSEGVLLKNGSTPLGGAIANGATHTVNTKTRFISVSIYDEAGSYDFLPKIKDGTINPSIKFKAANEVAGSLIYSKPVVTVTSNAKVTFNNICMSSTANTSFFATTVTDEENAPKLDVSNCIMASETNNLPFGFASNVNHAIEVDVRDCIIRTGGNTLTFNSLTSGKFTNTIFAKQSQGTVVDIKKTSNKGVEFVGCTFTQSGWDQKVFTMSGGKCTLGEGTSINGYNMAATVVELSGGTLIIDGATIEGDKGQSNTGHILLRISGTPDLQIKKATFIKGMQASKRLGSFTNDWTKFWEGIQKGQSAAFYESGVTSTEFAYEFGTVIAPEFSSKDASTYTLWIDECDHASTNATCTSGGTCPNCNTTWEEGMGHDFSAWKSNDENTAHTRICSRCGLEDETCKDQAHSGGIATCTQGKTCEVCEAIYDSPLGHDIAGKEHDSLTHWDTCSRCDEKLNIEEHKGGTASCTSKPVCEDCGAEYGSELGHDFSNYVSDNNAGCTTNGTETAKCSRCDKTNTRTILNSALGHDEKVIPAVKATCQNPGKTEGLYCERCRLVLKEQEDIPVAKYHTWDEGTQTVTACCGHAGVYTYKCIYCDATESIDLDKNPDVHIWESNYTVDKKATYFAYGSKSKHCKYCSAKTSVKKIAKLKLKTPSFKVAGGQGRITVKYYKVSGATGFQVMIKSKAGAELLTFNSTKSIAKYINLNGGTYSIYVRAFVKSGSKIVYSPWSAKKTAKVTIKVPTVSVSGTKGKFKVNYKKASGATGFQVLYTIGKKKYVKTFSTTKSASKYISAKKGTYKVYVRAFSKLGNQVTYSSYAKVKTVKVK